MTELMHKLARDQLIERIDTEFPYVWGRRQKYETGHYLDVIMRVLRSGTQWKLLKGEPCSWSTYHKKFLKWSKKGIFEKAFYSLTNTPQFQGSIGDDFFIDSCIIANKRGLKDEMIGLSYKHKFKSGTKISVISDDQGMPTSLHLTEANRADIKSVKPCLTKIAFPQNRIKNLGGDKGYVSKSLKKSLRLRGTNYIYYDKKNTKPINRLNEAGKIILKKRIKVEHTFSWLEQYRRISFRYERQLGTFQSFIYLAMINIIAGLIKNRFFKIKPKIRLLCTIFCIHF
jgi:putative transposase